jgi:hypothetical protein
MSSKTTFSEVWKYILSQCKYNNNDSLIITADEIKSCKKNWKGANCQFEPRLLCYQTSSDDRPEIFKQHNLFMLPIENGTYLLTKNNIYMKLDYKQIPIIEIEKDNTSKILDIGNSETSVIDNLRYSGIFETDDFLGEKITHGPLLNGRHYCTLDFELGKINIQVKGVQYEIDSCFESKNKILLIEGKSRQKQIDSFNIRQLYYPYRVLHSTKKEIICLFIHQLDKIINIWKYKFTEFNKMDSITCTGYYKIKMKESVDNIKQDKPVKTIKKSKSSKLNNHIEL